MRYTLSPIEMKGVERRAMENPDVTSLRLMERAACQVANAARELLKGGVLCVVCGAGNNGGDGLAAARLLLQKDPQLRAVVWQLAGHETEEHRVQRERLQALDGRATWTQEPPSGSFDCVIDALLGTGLTRAPEGEMLKAIRWMNACGAPVVAVDLPSGLNGATGRVESGCVRAAVTVTFHRLKDGLLLGAGPDCCGSIRVAEIGIPRAADEIAGRAVLAPGDLLLPARARDTHKGSYGRVLVVAGSFGMAGAAALCATAALRAGAGLVTVACPAVIVPTVQALCPCATCLPLPQDAPWRTLEPELHRFDALAVGCGLGRGPAAEQLTNGLFDWLAEHPLPAVLDADALNLLAARGPIAFPDSVILTPHPAEAARLLQTETDSVTADPLAAARQLHERYGASIVLKGAASVLIGADGEAINPYGSPTMAKGGSGDVLTGVLGALLAGRKTYDLQGVRLLQTACALHGLAGQAGAAKYGERGLLATELCEEIGRLGLHIPPEASTIQTVGASDALGRLVRVTVDRPLGSLHPRNKDIRYTLNYGYVADVLAADNAWQDAYLLGVDRAVEWFEGEIVAVIHRLDDVEDKWVVASPGTRVTPAEVRAKTNFVEQFFHSEIECL